MNKKFLTAFITPKEWDVVGYRLKPYSVRKYLNLSAVNSPYVTGQVPTARETVLFLKYCSSDCESIIDTPSINFFDMLAYAKIRYQPMFHAHVIQCIVNYIKEHSSGPDYRISSTVKGKKDIILSNNSLPEMLFLISACMAKLHMTEKQVMEMPIGRLAWYSAAITALEGADVRINPEEENLASEVGMLLEWEKNQAEKLRLAMVNGKIPKKRIKLANE